MTRSNSELEGMGTLRRSHGCGDVTSAQVGDEVIVAGWVQRRRDHGGVIFVDLRDGQGLIQVVFRPETSTECHERAGEIRSEYVIMVRGTVDKRSAETINPNLASGEIEVVAQEILVATSGVRALIRDGKVPQITNMMQTGGKNGMQTLEEALNGLLAGGAIEARTAKRRANNPAQIHTYRVEPR